MSVPDKPPKTKRMTGIVLPALVFGLGIVAISIGIPKEITVRKLASSGVKIRGYIGAIEHAKGKEIDILDYEVQGRDYPVQVELDDASIAKGHKAPRIVTYLPGDPTIATADLDADTKIANEYLVAGILEIGVGGWILLGAIRQRRKKLVQTVAAAKNVNKG